MAVILGSDGISKMYLGADNVDKAYLGADLVFPSVSIPDLFVTGSLDGPGIVNLYDVANSYTPVTFDQTPFASGDEMAYVRLSRDGGLLGVCQYTSSDPDNAFFLFDTESLTEVSYGAITRTVRPYYNQVSFSDTMICLAADSGRVPDFSIFDITTRASIHTISDGNGGDGWCTGFSPDNSLMVAGRYDHPMGGSNLTVYNTGDWSIVTVPVTALGGSCWVMDAKFSPDGAYLAAVVQDATDGKMFHLWDTATWTHSSAVNDVSDDLCSLCWKPDSSACAIVQAANSLHVQAIPGPYLSPANIITVPALAVTQMFSAYVDGGGSRTFEPLVHPISWTQNGSDIAVTDSWGPNLDWFNSSGTLISPIVAESGIYINAMTKKGDV